MSLSKQYYILFYDLRFFCARVLPSKWKTGRLVILQLVSVWRRVPLIRQASLSPSPPVRASSAASLLYHLLFPASPFHQHGIQTRSFCSHSSLRCSHLSTEAEPSMKLNFPGPPVKAAIFPFCVPFSIYVEPVIMQSACICVCSFRWAMCSLREEWRWGRPHGEQFCRL